MTTPTALSRQKDFIPLPTARIAPLFGNGSARDPVSGVAGWIGLHVISLGVNHQSSAAICENGVGAASHVYVVVFHARLGRTFRVHSEVRHVPCMMAFRLFHSMLLIRRIEMRTGGGERRLALRVLMNVQRVLARRQVLHIELDRDA